MKQKPVYCDDWDTGLEFDKRRNKVVRENGEDVSVQLFSRDDTAPVDINDLNN